MSLDDDPVIGAEIDEFTRILIPPDGEDPPIIVGGHAVGLWSRYYLSIDLQAGAVVGRVPLPHLVLKAKLANAALLEQNGRQDIKHVRMLILCVAAFIRDLLKNHESGAIQERSVINLLEEVREIVDSVNGRKVSELSKISLFNVWPQDELRSISAGKVLRWVEHRFS
jgi:hypothetical protein